MNQPTALTIQQLLEKHSPEPFTFTAEKDIVARSVTQWHTFGQSTERLGKKGYVPGLQQEGNTWANCHRFIYDIDNFRVEDVESWEGDIRDIAGLVTSPYFLKGFSCLDHFVELNYPYLVEEISEEALSKALDDPDLRVLMSGEGTFRFHGWDNRMFLDAKVGIERLAAARYIAGKLKKKDPIKGMIQSYHISYKAVRGLCEDFDLYAVKKSFDLEIGFFRAMQTLKASYYHIDLPEPLLGLAILLPKDDPQSMAVAAQFAQSGVTDLGQHLLTISSDQAFAPNT